MIALPHILASVIIVLQAWIKRMIKSCIGMIFVYTFLKRFVYLKPIAFEYAIALHFLILSKFLILSEIIIQPFYVYILYSN